MRTAFLTGTINEHQLPAIERRCRRLATAARRLGTPEPKLTAKPRTETVTIDGVTYSRTVIDIAIANPHLQIPGDWQVAAAIDHTTANMNVIHMFQSFSFESSLRTASPTCDHCHTRRSRKLTFVVIDSAGNTKRVGSSCIAEFLGFEITTGDLTPWDIPALDNDDPEREGGSWTPTAYDTKTFVTAAIASIDKHGWHPAASDMPTKHDIIDRIGSGFRASEAQADEADRIIEWAAALDSNNDFDLNLKAVLTAETVSRRNAGIAAYAPEAYRRHIAQELQNAQQTETEPCPSGRVQIEGVIVKTTVDYSFSYHGQVKMTVLVDGGWLVWGSMPAAILGSHVGDRVRFTATVTPKDAGFRFFKRPSSAEVVEEDAGEPARLSA